jgi:hypothetical protein
MELKTFFSNPKIMASSGFIAMGLKIIVAIIVSIIINLHFNKPHIFGCAVILFPIVALIFDIILYLLKDKIWTTLPDAIPDDWQITPEQLLAYAKHLPKTRLMRLLTCWVSLIFVDWNNTGGWFFIVDTMATITLCFLFSAFLDGVWLHIFKLKVPMFPLKPVSSSERDLDFQSARESTRRSAERIAKYSDASSPGSPAWFAQQHFNSK